MTVHSVIHGDCVQVMAGMEPNTADAIVCDPPYNLTNRVPDVKKCRECGRVLGARDGTPDACPRCGGELYNQRSQGKGFMGKDWDGTGVAFDVETWRQVSRVLKPGGYLLAFGGTRTHHRLMVAIEDAGFEIRDVLMWVFGSGFPKSLDVSKAIDRELGYEREVTDTQVLHGTARTMQGGNYNNPDADIRALEHQITAPASDLAKIYDGWGTALKPAYEPIIMARKPMIGTVADNVIEWDTGGLNIDGCRIETNERWSVPPGKGSGENWRLVNRKQPSESHEQGRWPANILFDEEAAALLDEQSGQTQSKRSERGKGIDGATFRHPTGELQGVRGHDDSGGASRFFYVAKASKADRNYGMMGREQNRHPTVKPRLLMQYLCRLVTPSYGLILDPFAGSGSTGIAAAFEGFDFIGIEQDAEYVAMARRRIAYALRSVRDAG